MTNLQNRQKITPLQIREKKALSPQFNGVTPNLQATIRKRLGDMNSGARGGRITAALNNIQVGQGPGYPQDPVITTRR
jgi:hypothetical protein